MKTRIVVMCAAVAIAGAIGASAYARYGEPPASPAAGGSERHESQGPAALNPDSGSQATSSMPSTQTPVAPPQHGAHMIVQGRLVCLPHKNTEGPQTMECAFGLRTDNGIYYAVSDTDPNYENIAGVPMDVRVEVEGAFAPRQNSNYQDIGIIHVTRITALR